MMKAPSELIVATGNSGKLLEITHLLGSLPLRMTGVAPAVMAEIHEQRGSAGGTLESNARLKAEAVQRQLGGWVLADDSGLFVDALHGAPGVDSAHFGGYPALLEMLQSVPAAARTAQFRCVLALARGGGIATRLFEGVVHGVILDAPRGEAGFGYDPVFAPDLPGQAHLRSYAEMALGEKAATSHRGLAAAAFVHWFKAEFA